MRGTTVKLDRSLRMRVLAASALAFVGLTAMICMVLPHAYETHARERFRETAKSLARGISFQLQDPSSESGELALSEIASWFVAHPDMEACLILDQDGAVIDRWPTVTAGWEGPVPGATTVETKRYTVAFQPLVEDGSYDRTVAVRLSTAGLIHELENTRWLFASIFLFTSGVFFVLARYLSTTILNPLEQIGRAAQNLADGEPVVVVPKTGDREIDELGAFISKLGENRRHSRVMESPLSLLSRRGYGAKKGSGSDASGGAAPDSEAGTRADANIANEAPTDPRDKK